MRSTILTRILLASISLSMPFLWCSCALVSLTGETVELSGKTASALVKTSGAVLQTTGKIGGSSARHLVGHRKVKLQREGNTWYVNATLNGNYKTRLAIDTGATTVQIPSKVAKDLRLNLNEATRVTCSLADGSVVSALLLIVSEIKIGGVKVKDVETVVVDEIPGAPAMGLLGMSFLEGFNFSLDTENDLLILKKKAN